jgi:S1-C subfamily serine protease
VALGLMTLALAILPLKPSGAQQSDRAVLLDVERRTIELFERASPSVVLIVGRVGSSDVIATEDQSTGTQTGTGFVWGTSGHIVTNEHVVHGTNSIAVRLSTGEVLRAEIVGTAPTYDLAVIRLLNPKQLPPPLAVGQSANLRVGQLTFAIGTPFGLDQSLTTGVISATKRRLPTSRGRELANVIQTDAAINPGNSGGPLLDSSGRLIGVNTAIYSKSGQSAGIGFAIPVDIVSRVVPELIQNGRVPTPGVGIVAAAESVATRFGVTGIIVMRVFPNSPAGKAGLKGVNTDAGTIGDVIVAVNGKPVHRIPEWTDELERIGVGGTIQLRLKRDDKEISIELPVIDARGPAPAQQERPAPPKPDQLPKSDSELSDPDTH